ncbi:MAG: hypothetical protein ABMA15_13335 [Vicinamibacterales bacterium]
MRRISLCRVVVWLCLACCLCVFSAAIGRAQSVQGSARTVLAAVVSGQGRPVVDVSLDDFVVTEGGQPREVLDAHVADYPLAVVLDDRPAVDSSVAFVRAAARRFIERVGERPIALFRLTGGANPLTTLDDDRATVLERLAELKAGVDMPASPLETIANAAALLESSEAPFSAIVVIAAAPVDASALVRGELLPQVIESGAAVHVVQAQAAETNAPADPTIPDLLRLIADQTHGQFTAIFSTVSYNAALDRLADRLAIEMMVQYMVPPGPKAGDVQVGVRLPGARVVGLGVR